MSDEELVKRLRRAGEYEPLGHDGWEAADRIEALLNLNEALVELLDDRDAKLETLTAERDDYAFRLAAAYNIYSEMHVELEALTEQLEAARADAKEAEAYAEELEAMNKNQEAMIRQADRRGDALEAKLAKAVEGLRDAVDAWDNHNKTGDMMQGHWVTDARATLAEIEGEKG
jgi:chromosome segregation ATPase